MIINFVYRKTITPCIISCAKMSAQSKKDFEAIETYNKLRKKPLSETVYSLSERKIAKRYFDQVKEFRKRSEEGFEPSKLFMVWRIASLVNRPMWEKEAIIQLGLHHHKVQYAIVKNTASNNKFLWSIKHLIRVKPITYPDGFPAQEDFYGTFLKQSGELIVAPRLKVDIEDLERDPEYEEKKLDQRHIREDLRLKWNQNYPKLY
ncbi:39S ribosomal protein L30, mitochondrial-like [Uloborus diversus]|uniref:39S ribosomal protein L30, mitochondrial-like n=1 Tax=Uloborus diversus TaxID=327109 RepID=UPI00240A49C4|nr:39S ribosomal protein L30, mitochondrial-like [Uloborus diversus]